MRRRRISDKARHARAIRKLILDSMKTPEDAARLLDHAHEIAREITGEAVEIRPLLRRRNG